MKIAIAFILALAVAGCSTGQLDKFNSALDNFDAAVARVDQSIAKVSPTLYAKCTEAQNIGSQLEPLATSSSTAGAGLIAVNSAIRASCQGSPPQNISQAIAAVIAAGQAGYQAYKSAKSGN